MRLLAGVGVSTGRVDGDGELSDVRAFQSRDLADTLLLDLVDAQHRMHGQVGALYIVELGLYLLLGWVDYHRRSFAENQFLDFDGAEWSSVAYFPCVDLVNLALIYELTFENVTRGHLEGSRHC